MKQTLRLRGELCPIIKLNINILYTIFITFTIVLVSCVCTRAQVSASSQEAGPAAEAVKQPMVAQHLNGVVLSATDSRALEGATVKLKGSNKSTLTNENGEFFLATNKREGVLEVSFLGYQKEEFTFTGTAQTLTISLEPDEGLLEEVMVSTGYQEIPKERATGSFVQIDNELLNRTVGPNILKRLSGVVSGLYSMGQSDAIPKSVVRYPSERHININIRGESTFNASTDPLIIVDNFPYNGDIENINPNDVESVTILKDAAAASIWGANAGNGVIVITTKKGRKNQRMKINFNSSLTVANKPDLFYNKDFLNAEDYIGVEEYLFNQRYFDNDIKDITSYPSISPVVEILAKQRDGNISLPEATALLNELRHGDVRKNYVDEVYQKAINQQYALGVRGGGDNITYSFSVGRDDNRASLIRNGYSRTTINSLNTFSPLKNLTLTAGINYSLNTTTLNNDFAYGNYSGIGGKYNAIFPYSRLVDENGNALSVLKGRGNSYLDQAEAKGFLDWHYRPLDEINAADNTAKVNAVMLRFGMEYQIIPQLAVNINYQNERQHINTRDYKSQSRYDVRDLINKFSIYDEGTGDWVHNFPLGGILTQESYNWNSNNLRGQLNFDHTIKKHAITAIAGAEVRELKTEGTHVNSYGYDEQFGTANNNLNFTIYHPTSPSGFAMIPGLGGSEIGTLSRYISYYVNAAYVYNEKYILNLSGRKDGANLFGAKTNNRITPLWSAGVGWNVNKEDFYDWKWLPYLRLRATYGYNGNVYQNGSAYLTGNYFIDSNTGLKRITNTTAPNAMLRWEKVRNMNLGIDFSLRNSTLSGTLELYQKNGQDLIQPTELAPQTGFSTYQANTASIQSRGLDVTINSRNLKGEIRWNSSLVAGTLKDRIVKYDAPRTSGSARSSGGVVGQPLYGVMSYQWAGLDPQTGDPQGYLNGQISKDYSKIINNYQPDNMIYSGTLRPTLYGTLRNDVFYKNIELSINISYRFGYVFRRPSTTLNYVDVLRSVQHSDYALRWQNEGDHLHTSVPSLVYPANSNRNTFYKYSEILIEKGDHIRLQDVRLSYTFPKSLFKIPSLKHVQFYAYANNLGIIWKKNKHGLDPDSYAVYPNPFSISFGVNANF